MLNHPHAPSANVEDALPNQHFFTWLKSRTALFVSQFLALLGFVYVPTSTLYYAKHLGESNPLEKLNPYVQIIVDVAHIAVLTLFVAVLLGIRHNNKEGAYRTLRTYESLFNETPDEKKTRLQMKQGRLQLRRFKHYFLWFWLAMLALYVSFTFKHGFELSRSRAAAEASALVSTACGDESPCVPAQESSTQPADHAAASVDKSGILDARKALNFLFFPFLTFALNNLSMMLIFWCFLIMCFPSYNSRSNVTHRLYVGYSSFFFVMLTVLYPLLLVSVYHGYFKLATLRAYATAFDGVSGVCNAVVLALLIARLDSKLIGLPSRLIGLLYFYSAVQPLFAVFEQPGEPFEIIQTSVLIIVFGFKIYFFLIIVYALQTGRMLNFLICFPQLERRVNSIWDNQLEVKASQEDDTFFHLTVTIKNKKTYMSYDRFKTLEECDINNAELRKAMKRRSSYHLGNETGTYWVDVVNAHGHKIFHSVSLKSEEEAKDLIEESMEKIPYCKYDRG
jgi:hypothetical protein